MIHSLSGGLLTKNTNHTFVKVKLLNNEIFTSETFWYLCDYCNVKINDLVLIPFGINNKLVKAEIIDIRKNENSQISPLPLKKMKQVEKILKEDI